jgi:hypothetical protein
MLPPPNPMSFASNGSNANLFGLSSMGNGMGSSAGSVPSTPLSAALGPAALATLPNKDIGSGGGSIGGSMRQINFFERADRLAATMSKRQPEVLYGGKKLA